MRRRLVIGLLLVSCPPPTTEAALWRVGPGGDHATIQQAVDAAVGSPEDDEIRVRAGSFAGSVVIPSHGGSMELSGGWDAAFASQSGGTTSLVGDGAASALVASSEVGNARTIRDLRVVGSGATALEVASLAGGEIRVERCRLDGNVGPHWPAARLGVAGGMLTFADSQVADNQTTGREGVVHAVVQGGSALISGNQFLRNRQRDAEEQTDGAALTMFASAGASVTVSDNLFRDNENLGPVNSIANALGLEVGHALDAVPSSALLEKNVLIDGPGLGVAASLKVHPGASLTLRDSVIVAPLGISAYLDGEGNFSNLTIDSGEQPSLSVSFESPEAVGTLFNSLLSASAAVFLGDWSATGNNLVGGDPRFVNAAAHDYRLFADSPAIDAGNDAPPGGLGATDVLGVPRPAGAAVDVGAHEVGPGPCQTGGDTLCLRGRFAVDAAWKQLSGQRGNGQAVALTPDTGYFWFFDPANVELVTKVLDACSLRDRFWVFAAGLTNVETAVVVTDTANGTIRRYDNPARTPFRPVQDTSAFATCP